MTWLFERLFHINISFHDVQTVQLFVFVIVFQFKYAVYHVQSHVITMWYRVFVFGDHVQLVLHVSVSLYRCNHPFQLSYSIRVKSGFVVDEVDQVGHIILNKLHTWLGFIKKLNVKFHQKAVLSFNVDLKEVDLDVFVKHFVTQSANVHHV